MESRKKATQRSSSLPSDYLKMVNEVFSSNFDEALKNLAKFSKQAAHFETSGSVFPEEIVLAVTLVQGKDLSATTVYASADFDPKASSPTIQDLLACCVDAIGSVYLPVLSSKKTETLQALISTSLSALAALENIPFEWTAIEVEKRRIHVKADKANPKLDRLADEWLKKNDPAYAEHEAQEEQETEQLFVTGERKPGRKGSGDLH